MLQVEAQLSVNIIFRQERLLRFIQTLLRSVRTLTMAPTPVSSKILSCQKRRWAEIKMYYLPNFI